MLGLWRAEKFVRQSVLVLVNNGRPGRLDWTELEGMDRLRNCKYEEWKVNF